MSDEIFHGGLTMLDNLKALAALSAASEMGGGRTKEHGFPGENG